MKPRRFDSVQFVVGAVCGGLVGFLNLQTWSHVWWLHALWVLGVAAVWGLLAGRFGDRVWGFVKHWLFWLGW